MCSHFLGETCHTLVAFLSREGRKLTLYLTSVQRNTEKKCLEVCGLYRDVRIAAGRREKYGVDNDSYEFGLCLSY